MFFLLLFLSMFLLFYFSAPGHKSNSDRCVYMPGCHCSGGGNYRQKEKYRWYVIKDYEPEPFSSKNKLKLVINITRVGGFNLILNTVKLLLIVRF